MRSKLLARHNLYGHMDTGCKQYQNGRIMLNVLSPTMHSQCGWSYHTLFQCQNSQQYNIDTAQHLWLVSVPREQADTTQASTSLQ